MSQFEKEIDELWVQIRDRCVVMQAMAKNEFAVAEENTKLHAENKRLKEQFVEYGELLDGANHDVEQLTKYADDLKSGMKVEYNRGIKDGLKQAAEIIRKV